MGKNMSADECTRCGDLIYYGGNNPCCGSEPSREEMIRHLEELESKREEAEYFILNSYQRILDERLEGVPHNDKTLLEDVAYHNLSFHSDIWYASTEILPHLEVQVVIDGKNNCFVTTGSSGYVEFGLKPPIGMSLPIRCWIHTHPFGSAYFSGTDIRTVSIWESRMEYAYVLGGEGHYGFWTQTRPQQLDIYRNGEEERTQTWKKKGDEEE